MRLADLGKRETRSWQLFRVLPGLLAVGGRTAAGLVNMLGVFPAGVRIP
jgi:hypothetical protein